MGGKRGLSYPSGRPAEDEASPKRPGRGLLPPSGVGSPSSLCGRQQHKCVGPSGRTTRTIRETSRSVVYARPGLPEPAGRAWRSARPGSLCGRERDGAKRARPGRGRALALGTAAAAPQTDGQADIGCSPAVLMAATTEGTGP